MFVKYDHLERESNRLLNVLRRPRLRFKNMITMNAKMQNKAQGKREHEREHEHEDEDEDDNADEDELEQLHDDDVT